MEGRGRGVTLEDLVAAQPRPRRAVLAKHCFEESLMVPDEDVELGLNPHRVEERVAAAQETMARLHSRGIEVSGREDPGELVELLTAVEGFEEVVQALGGDLMVDDLNSSQPDNPAFVVPARTAGESLSSYRARIDEAARQLRRHPQPSDG